MTMVEKRKSETLEKEGREKRRKEQKTSKVLREKGNEIFIEAHNAHYGPCALRLKLHKAEELYEASLYAVGNDKNEQASTYKNLAATNWFWGKKEWQLYTQNRALEEIRAAKYRIAKSLELYVEALEMGDSGAKPQIWVIQIRETIINNIFGWIDEQLNTHSVLFQPILINLCTQMDSGEKRSQVIKELATVFYMKHAEFILNQGFKYISKEERTIEETHYKLCLRAIKECYLPLGKAEGIVYSINVDELIKEFQDLKVKVVVNESKFEAIQARCQGDAILESIKWEDEQLVWDAIDQYKYSVSLSKEKDPESAAIALSRIGKVYSSRLKSEELAYRYYLESTQIVEEITCPHIEDSEWYKFSLLKVQQHENEIAENAARVEETIEVITREGEKSAQSFLKFIYKEHNHLDLCKRAQMGSFDNPANVKASLRNALLAFHPDKRPHSSKDCKKICHEIIKILISKLEAFK